MTIKPAEPQSDGLLLVTAKVESAKVSTGYYKKLLTSSNLEWVKQENQLRAALVQAETNRNMPQEIKAVSELADFYFKEGRYRDCEALQTKLLTIRENTLGPNHPDILLSLGKLAEVKRELQKYPELEAIFSRSLALRENLGPPNGELAQNLFELGFNYHFQGRYAEDKQLFKRAIGLWKQELKKDPTNIEALKGCGLVYVTVGQPDKATSYYQRALTAAKKKNGPNSKTEAEILDYLSRIQKTRKAEAVLQEQALKITQAAFGQQSLETAKTLHELGCAYDQDGNWLHAKNCFEQALNIREKLLPPNHPDIADSLFSLASCDLFLHKYAEAEPLYWLSIGITQEIFGPRHGLVSYRIQDGPALLCQDTKDWSKYKVLSDYAQSFGNKWTALPWPPKYDL